MLWIQLYTTSTFRYCINIYNEEFVQNLIGSSFLCKSREHGNIRVRDARSWLLYRQTGRFCRDVGELHNFFIAVIYYAQKHAINVLSKPIKKARTSAFATGDIKFCEFKLEALVSTGRLGPTHHSMINEGKVIRVIQFWSSFLF